MNLKSLSKDLCLHICASDPKDEAELLEQARSFKEPGNFVGDIVERGMPSWVNVVVSRFSRIALGEVE